MHHTITKATVRTTLADVIGTPSTWPEYAAKHGGKQLNMSGACITNVAATGDGIAIWTRGGIDGPTYAIFFVEDADLRARVMKVLEVGLSVNAAAHLQI